MKNIQFTGETFKLPEDFDVSTHVDLSFGICVTVGNPPKLREELIAEIERLREKYGKM